VPTPTDAVTLGCGDTPVYFELDSSSLTADSTAVVKGVVSCLTSNAAWKVTVEGHADERGGTQYNIALGERRARAVADYLKNAAIDKSRVSTVSFGEEKPADPSHNEAAWAKNRRVEFRILK
jgi:peptidoglycan-associated lipoprotein